MAAQTLTPTQANRLYDKGLALLDGEYNLTTRTAAYEWNPVARQYERVLTDLRVQHQAGARWNGRRFVACWCDFCEKCDPCMYVELRS